MVHIFVSHYVLHKYFIKMRVHICVWPRHQVPTKAVPYLPSSARQGTENITKYNKRLVG